MINGDIRQIENSFQVDAVVGDAGNVIVLASAYCQHIVACPRLVSALRASSGGTLCALSSDTLYTIVVVSSES